MSETPVTPAPAPAPPPGASRILAFVRAARTLLWAQFVFGLLAAAVTAWAVFAVRDLVSERDRLAGRVGELESQVNSLSANAAAPLALPPTPLPEAPVADQPVAPDANLVAPTVTPPAVTVTPTAEPGEDAPPREPPIRDPGPPRRDCAGADAGSPRCQRPTFTPTPELDAGRPRGSPLGTPNGEAPKRR